MWSWSIAVLSWQPLQFSTAECGLLSICSRFEMQMMRCDRHLPGQLMFAMARVWGDAAACCSKREHVQTKTWLMAQ